MVAACRLSTTWSRALAGEIRCAPYATFGTQALSDHAVQALADRRACLLAHHGVIACGSSLDEALALAIEVEHLARMYLAACTLGEPPRLDSDEMTRVLHRFETYGAPPATEVALTTAQRRGASGRTDGVVILATDPALMACL